MAINAQERRAIILALLGAFGEGGYPSIAQMIGWLIRNVPSVAWETELRSQAASYQPFIASGLSIQWWCDEVMRLAANVE